MPPPAGRDGSLFSEDDGLREKEQMNERTGLNFGGNNSLIDN